MTTREHTPTLDAAAVCRRAVPARIEVRADEGSATVEFVGHASVTDTAYEVWDWLGVYDETVEKGAFADVLGDDVRFLVNHDPNLIAARVPAGNLRLSEDNTGLRTEADLPLAVSYVSDLVENIRLGNFDQMSFAFTVSEERWEWAREEGERDHRFIMRVGELFDVSVVTYPANPNTDAGLRTAADSALGRVLRSGEFTDAEVVALCRRLATSTPPADPDGLAYRDHADRLVGAVEGFVRRTQGVAQVRASDGRTLTDDHVRRLTHLRSLLAGLVVAPAAAGDRTMTTRVALQEERALADMLGLPA